MDAPANGEHVASQLDLAARSRDHYARRGVTCPRTDSGPLFVDERRNARRSSKLVKKPRKDIFTAKLIALGIHPEKTLPGALDAGSAECARTTRLVARNIQQSPWQAALVHDLGLMIRDEGAETLWLEILPARVGRNAIVDLLASGIVELDRARRQRRDLTAVSQKSYSTMTKALPALREFLGTEDGLLSDDALIATAMLAPFEALRGGRQALNSTRSHLTGLATISKIQAQAAAPSGVATRILGSYCGHVFLIACVCGEPSPFGILSPECYQHPFADRESIVRLNSLRNQMFARLPKLIQLCRDLYVPLPAVALSTYTSALALAGDLLELEDRHAEQEVREGTPLRRTCVLGDDSAIPWSFDFASAGDFKTLVQYWQLRLSLLRICVKLRSSGRAADAVLSKILPPTEELVREGRRLSNNLVMTIQHARSHAGLGADPILAQAMLAVWGAVKDGLSVSEEDSQGQSALKVEVLGTIRHALRDPRMTEADATQAAELFVGGPLEGRYVDLHRMLQH